MEGEKNSTVRGRVFLFLFFACHSGEGAGRRQGTRRRARSWTLVASCYYA